MASRLGRKRKVASREANGRIQRPSKAEREAARLRAEQGERSTVLAQPHRLGNYDQLCASALGRHILDHRLRRELYDAGEEYAATTRRWRAAKGVPEPFITGGRGNGVGTTDEAVERLEVRLAAMRKHIAAESGDRALSYLDRVALDDATISGAVGFLVTGALMALAQHLGMANAGTHPYR